MKILFKQQSLVILILSAFFLSNVPMVMPQQTEYDTKTLSKKYAAFQAALRAIEQWKSRDIEGIVEDCTQENFERENIKRKDSENNLYGHVKNRLKEKIDDDLKTISRNFFGNRELELFAMIKKRFSQKIDKSVFDNLEVKYRDIFKKSREKAISKQVRALSLDIYPDPHRELELLKAFENAFMSGWREKDTNSLREKLRIKIRSNEYILEEVRGLNEEIIKEILRDIRSQMETQLGALKNELSQKQITWVQMQEAMIRNVEAAINSDRSNRRKIFYTIPYKGETIQLSKEINRVIYNLFEFVNEKIEKEAKRKEKERFKHFCTKVEFKVWSRKEFKTAISANLNAHRKSTHSADIIVNSYFLKSKEATINEYKKTLQAGNKEKEEFTERLQGYLKSTNFKTIVMGRCKALMNNDLMTVRNEIAREQLKKYFPKLNNESWEVPKLSKSLHADETDIMKGIKVDNKRPPTHPEEFFRNKDYKKLRENINRGILLDNTEKIIIRKVQKLIHEAGRAWDGQYNIYGKDRDNIKDGTHKIKIFEVIEEQMEKEPDIDKKSLVEHFKKIILGLWVKHRKAIIWGGMEPRHTQGKYMALFEYIEKGIDRTLSMEIGRILKEIKEATERKKEEEERIRKETQEREKKERIRREKQAEMTVSKGEEATTGIGGGSAAGGKGIEGSEMRKKGTAGSEVEGDIADIPEPEEESKEEEKETTNNLIVLLMIIIVIETIVIIYLLLRVH